MSKAHYVHFHPDERPFVDRVTEWMERATANHEFRLTDFLDPRQLQIVQNIATRYDVVLRVSGGYEGAERCRAMIAPSYRYIADEPDLISLLQINLEADQAHSLDHGDFLGALLGLGIKRDRIGDLHIHERYCHCIVTDSIADYIQLHLHQVHRYAVIIDRLEMAQLHVAPIVFDTMSLTVASMRLDGIASDVYRISRSKIVDPIRAGRCKVNWKVEENPAKALQEHDVVSLQGFGRFKILAVDGTTKKGRIKVQIGKYS